MFKTTCLRLERWLSGRKTSVALSGDPSSVPNTGIRWLTSTCNTSSRAPNARLPATPGIQYTGESTGEEQKTMRKTLTDRRAADAKERQRKGGRGEKQILQFTLTCEKSEGKLGQARKSKATN